VSRGLRVAEQIVARLFHQPVQVSARQRTVVNDTNVARPA
jgi:hypothetical protein